MALASKGMTLDVVGSDEVDSPEMHQTPHVSFLNFQGLQHAGRSLGQRVGQLARFYVRLLAYLATRSRPIVHVLWNNKLKVFDRTVLLLYYKLLGKKIVYTAHNVNAGKRDGNNTLSNRLSLKMQYRLSDHIFVHTEKMKAELMEEFGVREQAVTVIPFGINNSVPDTDLTPAQAKKKLGLRSGDRAILFFGAIRPYKGLEYLVAAFQILAAKDPRYRLIIAGEVKRDGEQYMEEIRKTIARELPGDSVIQKVEFIPDAETEDYFKAADVTILPYTLIFQSGVLFLSYSFGLPVVATQVGSFGDDIVEGQNGFTCAPCDPPALAATIERYFASELFEKLDERRREIRDRALARHSWDVVGEMTRSVYAELLRS
jgi:glycosyltransferase involved in cell wall biosynthesis